MSVSAAKKAATWEGIAQGHIVVVVASPAENDVSREVALSTLNVIYCVFQTKAFVGSLSQLFLGRSIVIINCNSLSV